MRNLNSIPSLGKSNLLVFLPNDFKKQIFHINLNFPFYYYGSICSTLITLKARVPSVQDKGCIQLSFGIPYTIFPDKNNKLDHPNLQRRKTRHDKVGLLAVDKSEADERIWAWASNSPLFYF